ncbi:MAG: NAD(P)H-dependent oxidoreductase [Bifidobacteriaceae bacterium]|jgi:putative NADPH-quinone reductase|nr:NAD(P)H-dependent oxidoreductase [Bifidobacteriaceae bacterium]
MPQNPDPPPGQRKILAILGHPNEGSFNQAIFDAYVRALDGAPCEVETLELGKADFDPVLRFGYSKRMAEDPFVTRSQELITWADHLVVVFPVWWSQMPALLKGWFDRVFTPGFAYNMNGFRSVKHLAGRTATVVTTAQAPAWWLGVSGNSLHRLTKKQIFGLCGIKVTGRLSYGMAHSKRDTEERRAVFLEKVRTAARRDCGRH